jgi:hypothetical protein
MVEIPRGKVKLTDNEGTLSPPIVTQPLYGCATAVNVTGYVPDATLDVEINGAIAVPGFPGHSPYPFGALIPVPALVPGQKIRARQHHAGATSGWSPVAIVKDHTADYPAGLPRPELFYTPLYKCGVRTGVGNLIVGCNVVIRVNGANDGAVSGANNPQGVNLITAYDTGQHVRAQADLCGDLSPLSLEQIVQPSASTSRAWRRRSPSWTPSRRPRSCVRAMAPARPAPERRSRARPFPPRRSGRCRTATRRSCSPTSFRARRSRYS